MEFSLKQIANDPPTFIVHHMFNRVCKTLIIPVYVDDLMPLGDKVLMDNFKLFIPEYFNVSLMGNANHFLSIWISRNHAALTPYLQLDQATFALSVLFRLDIPDNSHVGTPLVQNENLEPNLAGLESCDPTAARLYQNIIGSLMYLMLGNQPNLTYAIGKLARFSSNPSQDHWDALWWVLTYLKNFLDIHLKLVKGASIAPEGYVNADYANDKSNRKSTTSYIFSVSRMAFSWSSKKEPTVATSTMEAEYIALFFSSQQAAWIEQFYKQISFELQNPIRIHCNSETAIAVAKKEESHKASKHLNVKFHLVHKQITNSELPLSQQGAVCGQIGE